MRRLLLLCLFLPLTGCGPMLFPGFNRLDDKTQAQVNQEWNNMLNPTDRLDRELLLDTIMMFQLHEEGVDRGAFHSEKDFDGGTVLMDVNYDRANEKSGWFDITIKDKSGQIVRSEHYSEYEVHAQLDELQRLSTPRCVESTTQPTTQPESQCTIQPTTQLSEDQKLEVQIYEDRIKQIMAATQPAS
jgi:hypothetical protein